MKFEKTEVWGFEHAIRGMRNPLESWNKSDSEYIDIESEEGIELHSKGIYYKIGKNDLDLIQKLIKAGSEHRKFLRQIFVSADITAPLYWWKEFDTYKIGTVSNSCSTMHKLASTPITMDCFEMDDFEDVELWECSYDFSKEKIDLKWENLIEILEFLRQKYNKIMENKKHLEEIKEFEAAEKAQVMAKKYWKELIRLLPESWLQKRTITMNYENILSMYQQRKHHKLTEWNESFINWVRTLPYAQELLFLDELKEKKNDK